MACLAKKNRVLRATSGRSGPRPWFAMGIHGHWQNSVKNAPFLEKPVLNLAKPILLKRPAKNCREH